MDIYRVDVTVAEDGTISLKGLPFRKGDKVEVTVRERDSIARKEKYPLRGTPVTYLKPFESVAEENWDALHSST